LSEFTDLQMSNTISTHTLPHLALFLLFDPDSALSSPAYTFRSTRLVAQGAVSRKSQLFIQS
jgi:hypothetical protein